MVAMPQYRVIFTDVALKNLKRYPKNDQKTILSHIEQLASDPHQKSNVKRLVNFDISYRMRVGRYRILFEKQDAQQIIDIIDILPRSKAYRRR